MSHRAIRRTILHLKRQVRGQGGGAYEKFHDPSRRLGCVCESQWSCVYIAKIERFSLCIRVCVCACVCVYRHECVKVGGGTGWENTPVCGLTKLFFCPQQ